MGYDSPFVRVTLIHSLVGTSEVAETGFNICEPGVMDAVNFIGVGSSVLGSIKTAWIALLGASNIKHPTWSKFTALKMAAVDETGHYLGEPVTLTASTTGLSSVTMPVTSTTVLSLRSGEHLGQANFGRMYLPYVGLALNGSDYHYQFPSSLVSAAQTFFGAVNTAAGAVAGHTNARVYIMSKKGSGTHKRATQVWVGDLPDVQRRRSNNLVETYSTGSI